MVLVVAAVIMKLYSARCRCAAYAVVGCCTVHLYVIFGFIERRAVCTKVILLNVSSRQDMELIQQVVSTSSEDDVYTHTQQRPFYGPLSGTTWVNRYQKKHSPTHHPDHHHPIFISFFHLPRSIASSLFILRAWQSFCTTSLHVLFCLPLGLEPCTAYSIHSFTH